MSSSASQMSKLLAGKKRKKTQGVKEANIGVSQSSIKRLLKEKVAIKRKLAQRKDVDGVNAECFSESDPSTNNVPSPMFTGDNTTIFGGQFIQAQSVNYSAKANGALGFKRLQKHVAPEGFHNSAQRVDPPRCHQNTRVAVLQQIYDWIILSENRQEWMLWLNGAVGSGKSAIMQSMAERCAEASIAIASFFFCRSDPIRNKITHLVATLVYQLIQVVPATSSEILLTIERNPLILDQSLEFQIQQLIILPLLRLPQCLKTLFVVFLDGLDECINRNHQTNLIKALGNVLKGRNIPVLFLIASRREPQLEMEFGRAQISNLLQTVPLDDLQSSDDIRRFLNDKFQEIKTTHIRRNFLSAHWPTSADIEEIIEKSSGQYIFASVIMNYISSPHVHPVLGLDIIKGIRLRSHSSEDPFAYLDTLYRNIFSHVKEFEIVRNILAFNLVISLGKDGEGWEIHVLESLFCLESGELEVLFADLAAVIRCKSFGINTNSAPKLKFLHASLPDFLLDKGRSEIYHIDLDEYRTKLLCMFLERSPLILDPLSATHNSYVLSQQGTWRLNAIQALLLKANASDRLQRAFMGFSFTFYDFAMVNKCKVYCIQIVYNLQQLNFQDQGRAYRHVLDLFAAGHSNNFGASFNPKPDPQFQSQLYQFASELFDGGIVKNFRSLLREHIHGGV